MRAATRSSTCGRNAGSLRRSAGFGDRSRGKRYGASVSISNRSSGMRGTAARSACSAPLVAHPARHADVETEVEIRLELRNAAREAMRDAAAGDLRHQLDERREEVRVRVALMQEHGLAARRGELELRTERAPLRVARRQVAKVVEPAFADGDDVRAAEQRGERGSRVLVEFRRVMRVHAGRREQHAGMRFAEGQGLDAAGNRGAGHNRAAHAGRGGAREHLSAVMIEAVVREIGADVDNIEHRRGL